MNACISRLQIEIILKLLIVIFIIIPINNYFK